MGNKLHPEWKADWKKVSQFFEYRNPKMGEEHLIYDFYEERHRLIPVKSRDIGNGYLLIFK